MNGIVNSHMCQFVIVYRDIIFIYIYLTSRVSVIVPVFITVLCVCALFDLSVANGLRSYILIDEIEHFKSTNLINEGFTYNDHGINR